MPIKIKSISFQNFYNYYGSYEQNKYEFDEGLNLIIADNEAGKSKFFNGFLWILINKVYDSDAKDYKMVGVSKFLMISDKAKKEALIDEELITGVKIEYSNNDKDFQIVKEIRAIKRKEDEVIKEENWEVRLTDPQVNVKSTLTHDFRPEYDNDEKKRIINNLLRPEFRGYALLQGEEVDQIIDLTNSESLTKAIDVLSNIKDIERLGELSNYLLGRANNDLDKQRKEATSNKENYNKLIGARNTLEKEISDLKEFIERDNKALTKAETEKEKLLTRIATAKERQDLRSELKNLERDYNRLEEEHNKLHENINNYFFDDRFVWLLLGSEKYIKEFSKKRENYLNAREEKRAEQRIIENPDKYIKYLTIDIPDIASLDSMLEKEVCFVCGRNAEKNSEPWNHINKVKQRPIQENGKTIASKNDLHRFFDDLQTNTRGLQSKLGSIFESAKKIRNDEQSFRKRKEDLQKKIDQIKGELFGLGGKSEDESKDTNDIQVYGNIESRITDYRNSIDHHKSQKELKDKELIKVKKDLDANSDQSIPEGYKKNQEVLENLNLAIQNTRERILDRMVGKLEQEANSHFVNLTRHSSTKGSTLKFVRTPDRTVRMRIEDSKGNVVTGESEGNQRMKKIAVVMAIITSSAKGISNYPFIADAPISAFGNAFIRGFFEQVPVVFKQSIILVKELYDNNTDSRLTELGQELLNNKIPGTLYINEIEPEKEQVNRETKIVRYI